MKKVIILALALVAGASLYPVSAGKKKDKKQPETPVVEPVQLTTSSDSVSYTAGMDATKGLVSFLVQQEKVDTAYMADFLKGFKEVATAGNDLQKRAYAAGIEIAVQVRDRILPAMMKDFTDTPDSLIESLVFRGFTDALENDSTIFTHTDAERFFRERREVNMAAKEEKLYGPNRDAGETFLAENAKKEGVVTTRSGLQYKVLVKGEGEIPKEKDKVQVHYEGRLVDGTVFDASKKHGDKPISFRADQVIKGWTEALTMMPVGSKWQLYIPYKLAYGNRNQGEIKPYSALIFDVELVGIVKSEK
ncbi:MAG: FKBP-type peptidyl-prolyl cis-trans isomerase [Prevotella sp.]|nr:FKBP-type peptidyl-prolyl cis-trans isomerase [Prevotella sp.]